MAVISLRKRFVCFTLIAFLLLFICVSFSFGVSMSFPQLTYLPCGSESSVIVRYPVPEFIKPFSCSTQLNMTFQLHMKAKMVDKKRFLLLQKSHMLLCVC